jgi:phosphatidylinositol dimannoside acyltransferase
VPRTLSVDQEWGTVSFPVNNPLDPDGAFLRRLALLGSSRGPELLVRGAPPIFGALFWALRRNHREGVRRNLRRILGPRPRWLERRDEIATFVAFARSMAEGMAAMGERRAQARVEVEGGERFDRVMAAGKGCIMVTAHTSAFELAGALLGELKGAEVVMVMRAEPDAGARRISDAARELGGLRVVHVGDDPLAVLPLVGHLRRGAVVALQIDRMPPRVRGLPVSLFGAPAELPLGPFVLAAATGAPVVPVFTRRTGFLEARLRVCEPVSVPRRASRAAMAELAGGVARELEQWVREAPTEWLDWGGA